MIANQVQQLATGAVGANSRSEDSPSVRGDLACLSAFELLQSMHYLRKCGTLRLETRDPSGRHRDAACVMTAEGLVDASCGSLQAREAVLTFAWWKEGQFVFESLPYYSVPDAIPLQEMLLDAVRLADELEVRDGTIPERTAPLKIGAQQALVDLDHIAAVTQIVKFLSANPGATRRDLEQHLPFAPVTLGFAVARLCEEGRVQGSLAEPQQASGSDSQVVEQIPQTATRTSIFRLSLAFEPASSELASELISELRRKMNCHQSSSFFDPFGLSFLRLRPEKDTLVSITALPVTFRNRFVFESLLPSLQLAVFISDGRLSAELDEWQGLVAPATDSFSAETTSSALDGVLKALRSREGLEQ